MVATVVMVVTEAVVAVALVDLVTRFTWWVRHLRLLMHQRKTR